MEMLNAVNFYLAVEKGKRETFYMFVLYMFC